MEWCSAWVLNKEARIDREVAKVIDNLRLGARKGFARLEDAAKRPAYAYVVRGAFRKAVLETLHGEFLRACVKKYGADGPLISGGKRDHWPNDAKEKVRWFCRQTNYAVEAAFNGRPPRVHKSTIRFLMEQASAFYWLNTRTGPRIR